MYKTEKYALGGMDIKYLISPCMHHKIVLLVSLPVTVLTFFKIRLWVALQARREGGGGVMGASAPHPHPPSATSLGSPLIVSYGDRSQLAIRGRSHAAFKLAAPKESLVENTLFFCLNINWPSLPSV